MNLYADTPTNHLKNMIEVAEVTITAIAQELENSHWREIGLPQRRKREETKRMIEDRLCDMRAELARREAAQQEPDAHG